MNKIHPLLLAFLILPCIEGHAQKEFAREHTEVLCSPEYHGRGYVKNGHRKAAEYIAERFEEWGVEPLMKDEYFQEFKVDVNTFPRAMEMELGGDPLDPGVDFIPDPSSGSGKGTYEPLVVTPENIRSEEMQQKLGNLNRDQLIVLDPKGLEQKDSLRGFKNLKYVFGKKLPVIVLSGKNLTWGGSTKEFPHPILEVWRKTWEEHMEKNDGKVFIHVKNQFKKDLKTQNVGGIIKGEEHPEEYIVLSAHYDHLGRMGKDTYIPGASDNASGTSMVMYFAEHFSKEPPDVSIVFLLFGAEEIGIIGSRYFTSHSPIPLDSIRFVINTDIMGGGSEGITAVNGKVHEQALERLREINEEKELLPKIKARGEAMNSDHYWFTKNGVPAFFIYTLGDVKAYHDVHDTASDLPFTKFNEITELLHVFINDLQEGKVKD